MNPTLSGGTVREARVNLGSVAPRRATEAEAILRGATAGAPPETAKRQGDRRERRTPDAHLQSAPGKSYTKTRIAGSSREEELRIVTCEL